MLCPMSFGNLSRRIRVTIAFSTLHIPTTDSCSAWVILEELIRRRLDDTPNSSIALQTRPIGSSVKSRKKSGWNGSLTLSLDGGEKKEFQTNRIQAQCTRAALQSHSAASGL